MNESDRQEVIERLRGGHRHEGFAAQVTRWENPDGGGRSWGVVRDMDDDTIWETGPLHWTSDDDRQIVDRHLVALCALWIADYLELSGDPRTVKTITESAAGGAGAQPPVADSPLDDPAHRRAVRDAFDALYTPLNPLTAMKRAESSLAILGDKIDQVSQGMEDTRRENVARPALVVTLYWIVAALSTQREALRLALVSIRTSRETRQGRSDQTGERSECAHTRSPGSPICGECRPLVGAIDAPSHERRRVELMDPPPTLFCLWCRGFFWAERGWAVGDSCQRCARGLDA